MPTTTKISEWFDARLAALLAERIESVYTRFDTAAFVAEVGEGTDGKTYTQRIAVIADTLRRFLPQDYARALNILTDILGPENPNETGMFKEFYWVLPIGKFIESYGLEHFDLSMDAIAEVTKRNTGEYAVRPFIRKYPKQALQRMRAWARSDNFHLRRLASEGLRPKLPWASKLDTFIDNPEPVFEILELLKDEHVRFVRKSVANHLRDYLKVNPQPTRALLDRWAAGTHPDTLWMVKHALNHTPDQRRSGLRGAYGG